MSKANEPAFPQTNEQRYDDPVHGVITPSQIQGAAPAGLTKREYFAAMAMQGILSGQAIFTDTKMCSETAVRHADALLSALSEPAPSVNMEMLEALKRCLGENARAELRTGGGILLEETIELAETAITRAETAGGK